MQEICQSKMGVHGCVCVCVYVRSMELCYIITRVWVGVGRCG